MKELKPEIIELSEKNFQWFVDRLNEPPKSNPKLKALLESKTILTDK